MNIILSHPTGNANVRAAANGFATAQMLQHFYTSIACFPKSKLDFISGFKPFSEIKRRQFDDILEQYTTMYPLLETGRLIAPKVGLNRLTAHETGILSIDNIYRKIDKNVSKRLRYCKSCCVYAYEDGAYYSFIEALRIGMPRLYDLPIGYWRTARILLEKEKELWPDWAETLIGFSDSDEKLARKDEELRLANHIFVASKFTAKTLEDYPGQLAPVQVIPYGFPPINTNRKYSILSAKRPLKFLFVGGLSQRKGIANLFAAVEKFSGYVELTVVGRKSNKDCQALNQALNKHNWIDSLSHKEILKLMAEADVFIFPSLFEGFGLVITEAMSQGTPVITTDRTAGPDLITNGQNGWLVDAGSTQALQEAIETILNKPGIVKEAGKEALNTAGKRPWSQYGFELAEAVKQVLTVKYQ